MFNIELVPAQLTPFEWASSTTGAISNQTGTGFLPTTAATAQTINNAVLSAEDVANIYATAAATGFAIGTTLSGQFNFGNPSNFGVAATSSAVSASSISPGHPLYPLTLTGGLVFPFNPVISENLGVRYDVTELTHANESIHAYKATDNVRLTLSECVWVADTFDQAVYTLGVIHFFRSFTLMDFGRKKPGSGKPPSPMWFNAYGNYMYSKVPVLIERVDWSFPQDLDYVGVPNPGTPAYVNQQIAFSSNPELSLLSQSNGYTWIPIKLTIGSISMIVQHSINYWAKEFSLDDFRAGKMIGVN